MGNNGNSVRLYFLRLQIHCRWWLQPWIKTLAPLKKSCEKSRQHFKKQGHYLLTKAHLFKAMVFPVVVYGCESRTIKKAEHWRIDLFELWSWRRVLRVPWTARSSNQSIKGNQLWIFIERIDAEVEAPILWSPDGKDPEAVKDWWQEEKRWWQKMRWLDSGR